jgi:hypothetical protein
VSVPDAVVSLEAAIAVAICGFDCWAVSCRVTSQVGMGETERCVDVHTRAPSQRAVSRKLALFLDVRMSHVIPRRFLCCVPSTISLSYSTSYMFAFVFQKVRLKVDICFI